jgi:hypothetical protein
MAEFKYIFLSYFLSYLLSKMFSLFDPYEYTDTIVDDVSVRIQTRFVFVEDEESDEVFVFKSLAKKDSSGYLGYYKTIVTDRRTNTVLYTHRSMTPHDRFCANFKLGYFRCAQLQEQIKFKEHDLKCKRYRFDNLPVCNCDDYCDCDRDYKDTADGVHRLLREIDSLKTQLAAARSDRAFRKKLRRLLRD